MSAARSVLHFVAMLAVLFGLSAMTSEANAQISNRSDLLFRPWAAQRSPNQLPSQPEVGAGQPRFHERSGKREFGADRRLSVSKPCYLPKRLCRRKVNYSTKEPAGTVVVDTKNTYLYLVLGNGKAIRYGIGVARDGFVWGGRERISRMAEWPNWHPPADMIKREPDLPRFMPGGLENPLGARALYLGNTLYRIHGTNEPSSIGTYTSSGCIRLINEDIIDLYQRVRVGSEVVVLSGG